MYRKHKNSMGPTKVVSSSVPRRNMVGCRIQHIWKEGSTASQSLWKGMVLDQVPVNPSLYLIKYDGFDSSSRASDVNLADTMIGKAVEHMFETEDGTKDEWRGMVLARAPIMNTWFFITYEKDPVLYMYQLLDDYKEGDLRIMPDSSEYGNTLVKADSMYETLCLITRLIICYAGMVILKAER
ncbi:unnamed protein product [Coregonus sp. 'balchen']|nr:unnamed protein product [Coregonus sp. 'balchen']